YAAAYPAGAHATAFLFVRSALSGQRVAWKGREYHVGRIDAAGSVEFLVTLDRRTLKPQGRAGVDCSVRTDSSLPQAHGADAATPRATPPLVLSPPLSAQGMINRILSKLETPRRHLAFLVGLLLLVFVLAAAVAWRASEAERARAQMANSALSET